MTAKFSISIMITMGSSCAESMPLKSVFVNVMGGILCRMGANTLLIVWTARKCFFLSFLPFSVINAQIVSNGLLGSTPRSYPLGKHIPLCCAHSFGKICVAQCCRPPWSRQEVAFHASSSIWPLLVLREV